MSSLVQDEVNGLLHETAWSQGAARDKEWQTARSTSCCISAALIRSGEMMGEYGGNSGIKWPGMTGISFILMVGQGRKMCSAIVGDQLKYIEAGARMFDSRLPDEGSCSMPRI